jgi:hypothetical protein
MLIINLIYISAELNQYNNHQPITAGIRSSGGGHPQTGTAFRASTVTDATSVRGCEQYSMTTGSETRCDSD